MNGDLFDNVPEAAPVTPAKPKRENLRKGSQIRIIADSDTDPHELDMGSTGTVLEIVRPNPEKDTSAAMWREDGSHFYLCDIEGADVPVELWPEEIERA